MKTTISSNKVLNENGSHSVVESGYLDEKEGLELTVASHASKYLEPYVSVAVYAPHITHGLRLNPADAAALRDMLTNALARLDVVIAAKAAAKNGGAQ